MHSAHLVSDNVGIQPVNLTFRALDYMPGFGTKRCHPSVLPIKKPGERYLEASTCIHWVAYLEYTGETAFTGVMNHMESRGRVICGREVNLVNDTLSDHIDLCLLVIGQG